MSWFTFILYLGYFLVATHSLARFSNIQCTSYDSSYSSFEKCNLKMIGRNVVGLNVTCKLYQFPVENVTLRLSLFKKSNGFTPFIVNNMTIDFCSFLRNPQQSPLVKMFYDYVYRHTNANHTCPYNHDIIVENLVMNDKFLDMLLMQRGEYMMELLFGINKIWKANVKAFVKVV